MFTHRLSLYPLPGNANELRPLLEERVRERQGEGFRASLARTMYGEQTLAVLHQFDNLAAREKTTLTVPMAAAALVSRASEPSLHEVLVPSVPGDRPVKYVEVFRVDPLSGKTGAVRSLLMKRVEDQLAHGDRVALSVEIYGQRSGVFAYQPIYESLAELEEARAYRVTDEGFLKYAADLAPLVARRFNAANELVEVLVPFQRRD